MVDLARQAFNTNNFHLAVEIYERTCLDIRSVLFSLFTQFIKLVTKCFNLSGDIFPKREALEYVSNAL
jgi:hypothetical protein